MSEYFDYEDYYEEDYVKEEEVEPFLQDFYEFQEGKIMFDVKIIEETRYKMIVLVEQVKITFEGEHARRDANAFVIELLKDTGRIGY